MDRNANLRVIVRLSSPIPTCNCGDGVAGLHEIGGGYLAWLWSREGKGVLYGIAEGVALVLYGLFATFQPAHFGRVYATYGGVFIVLSSRWGWRLDKITPDRFDIIRGLNSLPGVLIIMYWPRG